MTEPETTTEEREKELKARLQAMEQQLERLTARLGDGEAVAAAVPVGSESAKEKSYPPEDIADVSEEVLNWASRTSLLPRLAALCFLLVVALILRTITDSGLINKLVGSGVGMAYAAVLMIVGWYRYGKESPLAPIFAASGAILMSTVVVETHTHFNALPLVPAYLTLMATGIGMALISRQFNAFTPISVGILTMCFAGAAIDYPHPFFPYLSLVLFTANLLGYFAAQLKRCSWLRWSALIVTMIMLQLWSVQIVTALRKGGVASADLSISWFLPVMALFTACYLILALLGIIRSATERIPLFDLALPTITVLWAFSVMLYVSGVPGGGSTFVMGAIGVLIAVSLLSVSFWLAQRGGEGAPGASSYTFACGVLLAIALPAATGSLMLSLPILSLVAIFMAVMSRVWNCGTIRLTTYLFHIYCCVAMVIAIRGDGPAAMDAVNILPAGLLACIILYQYQWCRWWPPTEGSSFFRRFDANDRSASMLLLAGLISGFFMVRIALFQIIAMLPAEMHRDAFRSSQSVLINTAAIALILFAFLKQNKEIRNVAILVMVLGGIKVFLYDLMGIHGLPLVFSVLSFGLAAAAESIALGKWQKKPVAP
ncbi:MAG: hypothetical protein WCI45_01415 [Desulfuromonadales bacterium]